MHRIRKLLWMILILWIVFFIICDERWIKIEWDKDHIVLHKIEKKSDLPIENIQPSTEIQPKKNVVYKNSDLVHLSILFKEEFLRKSDGLDPKYLAKIEQEKTEVAEEKVEYWRPNIIPVDDTDIIDDIIQDNDKNKELSWKNLDNQPSEVNNIKTWKIYNKNLIEKIRKDKSEFIEFISLDNIFNDVVVQNFAKPMNTLNFWRFNKYILRDINRIVSNIAKVELETKIEDEIVTETKVEDEVVVETKVPEAKENTWHIENITVSESRENAEVKISVNTGNDEIVPDSQNEDKYHVDKYKWWGHTIAIKNWVEKEKILYKVNKYILSKHNLYIKKWVKIRHEFVIPESSDTKDIIDTWNASNWISDTKIEDLISSEEIDINTLESENDEFLQEVFRKTKNYDAMNLIVETYLSEYQFVKAKKFIESLPESDAEYLDPLLNLQVLFNSFALTSKTTDSTLENIVENYKSKNLISVEDRLWYLWVIALMQQNYNRFFEIANNFTIDKHKNFAAKLQWYKDQIAKQMWMPDYYFDTLVALELFNQWFFQPAKVLALYSLQQNQNYILPYQILAYANFLTNSRDTSIEYLKKLMDIDPTNAEKYRFLMWIAYYRDEKYEQSVVMLSLVKNEKLRTDAERYLIRNYIHLDQKTRLISIWNKILWYDNLVASDFYTYFYEAFYRPFSEWEHYQVYAYDGELANKMIRVCSMKLPEEEKAVCNYWAIGKNIALWQFEWLEENLLKLAKEYPQWYLYHALWEYYLQQWDTEKAKAYLLKAVSMTKKTPEIVQIKKLLQETM